MLTKVEFDVRFGGRWLILVRAAWLAIALFALALYVAGIPLRVDDLLEPCQLSEEACIEDGLLSLDQIAELEQLGLSTRFWLTYLIVIEGVSAGVWFAAGSLIFVRKSENAMALFVSLFLVTFGLGVISTGPTEALAVNSPGWWLPVQIIGFLGNACSGLFAYLFPSGRFEPRWTQWLAIGWIALSVPVYFFPTSLLNYQNLGEAVALPVFFGFLATFVTAQIIRYRRISTVSQRQQTKWVVFGSAIAILGFLGSILTVVINPALERAIFPLMFLQASLNGFMLLIPISFGIAILRSRLWDIDVIIRRTLVYAALTGMLALVYFGGVTLVGSVVSGVTGQQSTIAIVISTLAIAALFSPLRRRVQDFIDRRFYRKKYDGERIMQSFATAARDEVDMDKLASFLLGAVTETMQPERVSLWMKPRNESGPLVGVSVLRSSKSIGGTVP